MPQVALSGGNCVELDTPHPYCRRKNTLHLITILPSSQRWRGFFPNGSISGWDSPRLGLRRLRAERQQPRRVSGMCGTGLPASHRTQRFVPSNSAVPPQPAARDIIRHRKQEDTPKCHGRQGRRFVVLFRSSSRGGWGVIQNYWWKGPLFGGLGVVLLITCNRQ